MGPKPEPKQFPKSPPEEREKKKNVHVCKPENTDASLVGLGVLLNGPLGTDINQISLKEP